MGQDGKRGCDQLRAAGAEVVAQDQASSVVWGMPGAVVGAGLAHAVLPLAEIGGLVAARGAPPPVGVSEGGDASASAPGASPFLRGGPGGGAPGPCPAPEA